MPGKFEIFKDKKGEFRFRLVATNGETILASEGYKTKPSCQNGIKSVQKNGPEAARFERKTAKNGKFQFVLKSGNHQVIGTSQLYDSEKTMEAGVKSVQKNATTIKVDDHTV